jgi:hypothetical protein
MGQQIERALTSEVPFISTADMYYSALTDLKIAITFKN